MEQKSIRPYTAAWYHWAAAKMKSTTHQANEIAFHLTLDSTDPELEHLNFRCFIKLKYHMSWLKSAMQIFIGVKIGQTVIDKFLTPPSEGNNFKRLDYGQKN